MLAVNAEEIEKIMRDLNAASKVTCVLYDEQQRGILGYPHRMIPFCKTVRSEPGMEGKCLACDRAGFHAAFLKRDTHIYQCHMGLTECVVPIIKQGAIIGYIMMGQGVSRENLPKIEAYIESFPNPEKRELLRQQLSQMEVFTNEQLQAIANVARMCTSYLWLKELISLRGNPTAFAISEYISEHLSESLTVDSLCARFGISKTALYLLSTESFGSGITAYIQQQRIQRAMQMLEDGSHSVGDIADAVGFSDPNYFIKVFKAHTGYTPLRWRNRNTAAEQ